MRLAEASAHRLPQGREMRRIPLVIGETGEVHAREPPQMLQHVPGADLVAPVRRIGNAMGEEENLVHQPRPRAMGGPKRLASQSGSFFQAATCRRYLGSSGLISRGGATSAVRVA